MWPCDRAEVAVAACQPSMSPLQIASAPPKTCRPSCVTQRVSQGTSYRLRKPRRRGVGGHGGTRFVPTLDIATRRRTPSAPSMRSQSWAADHLAAGSVALVARWVVRFGVAALATWSRCQSLLQKAVTQTTTLLVQMQRRHEFDECLPSCGIASHQPRRERGDLANATQYQAAEAHRKGH